jgi:hypothetical protein
MSEQMDADQLVGMIRTAVFRSQTQDDMDAAWDDAEALILADRKATVERCKEVANKWIKGINIKIRVDYGVPMLEWTQQQNLLDALDAVLEDKHE